MKKLRVYDFDGTLAHTKSHIHIEKVDGSKLRLNPIEYSNYIIDEGDSINFDEFDDVLYPVEIQSVTRRLKDLQSDEDIFIVTARREASVEPIRTFLKSIGIETYIPIAALDTSDVTAKARWIAEKIEKEGYDDIFFIDDSERTIKAVTDMLSSKLNIKWSVQYVRGDKTAVFKTNKIMPESIRKALREKEIQRKQRIVAIQKAIRKPVDRNNPWIPQELIVLG